MRDAEYCRDAIERFLDRSWMLESTPLPALKGNRVALNALNAWMQRHRAVALTDASASDVHALLDSRHWSSISRQVDSLLGLITRFFRCLQDCKARQDDPIETMINQQLALAARRSAASRSKRNHKPARKLHFSGSPVIR